MKNNYQIIIPQTKSEIEEYYMLRFEILRKPWGQPESSVKDEWEEQSLHVLMIDSDKNAVATGRLQFNTPVEGQVRSMAVKETHQRKGLGTEVLNFIEEEAKKRNIKTIILDARDHAVNFYKKNGYEIEGDSYTLFEVIPHFRMIKEIQY